MTQLPDDLLPLVQSAVQLAEDSGLRQRLLALAPAAAAAAAAAAGEEPEVSGGAGARAAATAGVSSNRLLAGGDDAFGDQAAGGWLAGVGVSELGWLYFALAKALDDRGAEAGQVWHVLEQANALLSSLQPYDPDHDWQQLRIITGVFRAPLMRAAAAAATEAAEAAEATQAAEATSTGLSASSAVFIVGLPRSGSTLVETMLSRYPGVWAAGEDTALAPLTPLVNSLLASRGLSQPAALVELGQRYLKDMQRRAVAAGWDPSRPPLRIVDKMLRNLWLIGYIEMLLPRACIVHVVRHPLDVALSCYSQPFGYSGVRWSWRLDHIGEQVRMAAALAAHWRGQLPPGRLLTLHYEELVAAPEASARRLLSHCGLAWEPTVMQFYTANRTVATASVAQVRKPLYKTSVGRWHKYEKQLAELAEQIRQEILSYEADLAVALRAAEAENRRLAHPEQPGERRGTREVTKEQNGGLPPQGQPGGGRVGGLGGPPSEHSEVSAGAAALRAARDDEL